MLEDNIHQVKKTTMSQSVVQQLIELITNGTIPKGSKLPSEKRLMEMFGVGRSTLREATNALITLGLIEKKVPEGSFVSETFGNFYTKHLELISKISFSNIVELIEARIQLEMIIAEMAALKSNEMDHQMLDEVINSMKGAESDEQFLESDFDFHILVSNIAKNSFLFEVMQILHSITKEWISKVIKNSSVKSDVIEQHEVIANAIKTKDSKLAKELMKVHLEAVSSLLLDISKEGGDM